MWVWSSVAAQSGLPFIGVCGEVRACVGYENVVMDGSISFYIICVSLRYVSVLNRLLDRTIGPPPTRVLIRTVICVTYNSA